METINIDYLKKLDIRVGTVIECFAVEGSEKLLKLTVDFGTEIRTILSGIAKFYAPQTIVGRQLPFILNLEERQMMGLTSQGMLLAIDNGTDAVFLLPDKAVEKGSKVI